MDLQGRTVRRRRYPRLVAWYMALLAVIPQALMAAFWIGATRFGVFSNLDLPFTIYCMPVALLLRAFGGVHFYMHAGVFPADAVGWVSVFLFWSVMAAAAAYVHAVTQLRTRYQNHFSEPGLGDPLPVLPFVGRVTKFQRSAKDKAVHAISRRGTVRKRPLYALAVAATIGAGLASRRFPVLGKYPGDALWALMVFFALGFAFPKARSSSLALVAVFISCAVEFLKLNQAPWLVSIRQSTLGHLVFGHVFSWQNLVAYAAGISVGLLLERCVGMSSVNRVE